MRPYNDFDLFCLDYNLKMFCPAARSAFNKLVAIQDDYSDIGVEVVRRAIIYAWPRGIPRAVTARIRELNKERKMFEEHDNGKD